MNTIFEGATAKDMDSLFKHMDETIINQKKERYIKHYVDIINNVLDQKRDEELSRVIEDGIDIREVVSRIDRYDTRKNKFENEFRKIVTIEIAE